MNSKLKTPINCQPIDITALISFFTFHVEHNILMVFIEMDFQFPVHLDDQFFQANCPHFPKH
jgi:hypothetical protein